MGFEWGGEEMKKKWKGGGGERRKRADSGSWVVNLSSATYCARHVMRRRACAQPWNVKIASGVLSCSARSGACNKKKRRSNARSMSLNNWSANLRAVNALLIRPV